jgi:hypothetical protein
MAASLSLAVREMAVAGIVANDPRASDREIRRQLATRLYGEEIAQRLFGSRADGG